VTFGEGDTNSYELHWTVSPQKTVLSVGIKAKSSGWIGFGISPNGQSNYVLIERESDVDFNKQNLSTASPFETTILQLSIL
jgi:hypothetical protein